jgi:iron complex outermembrane recepter protein
MGKGNSILFLTALLFIFFNSIHVFGQNCFKGRIFNSETGQVVNGANILINGVVGGTSGPDGRFEKCNINGDSITARISFIGFETQTLVFRLADVLDGIIVSLQPVSLMMDEYVVTATRTENALSNAPLRVNLVTPRLLESAPLQSVDEVLKYVPGVNWSRPFGIFSTKAIVSMRGLSGKEQGRILVLLDGIPINKSDGGTVDWNMVDMDLVKKIEITKGAGSALYGGNAMGGVINIITQLPSEKFYSNASVEYGTFNTMGGKVKAGGKNSIRNGSKTWFWNAGTYFKQSDGYITQSPADVQANPYIIKSNMREFGANIKTGISLGENHTISAMLNYYNDHRGTGEKVHQEDGNVTDHDSYGITLNYKGNSGKYKFNISLFDLTENYIKLNEYLKDDYTWYDVLSVRRDLGSIATVSVPIGIHHLLTGGFDLKHGSVDAYDKYFTSTDIVYNEGKMFTYSFYLQDELNYFNNRLRMVAGLRYDAAVFYDGSFRIEDPSMETSFMHDYQLPDMQVQHWNAFSPRLSAQFKLKGKTRIYAMVSRGFRPSVLDDLCRSGRIKGGFKIANPSLMPEYLNNYEVGIDLVPASHLTLNASVYYSRGKDFQYYVSNGQTIDMGFGDRPIFIRANISDVEIRGLETEVKYEPFRYLSFTLNYSLSNSIIKDYRKIALNDTIDLSGKYFTDVPGNIFSLGANFNHSFINAGLWLHYTDRMYINDQNGWDEILLSETYPDYTTVDVKLWKEFKDHYKASLNIQNLLDVKYYDSKYAVCPGRFITLEFSYRF